VSKIPGYFKKLKDLMVYNEPSKIQPFELLENEEEKSNNEKKQNDRSVRQYNDQNGSQEDFSIDKINQANTEYETSILITEDLEPNLQNLKKELNVSKNKSVILREFKIGRNFKGFIAFVEGISDKHTINEIILRQLMDPKNFSNIGDDNLVDYIMNNVVSINKVKKESRLEPVVIEIIYGMTALFIDGYSECILMGTSSYDKRNIEKPVTENVIRGSQEGFTEDLYTNLSIIRRIIKNRNLISETVDIGKTNNTKCAILYIEDIANDELVKEVRRRVKSIDVEGILGDGMLEQLLEDHPFMLLPQILGTERPDRTCSFLMEGKVAIIMEGAPFADIVPITFFHLFHTSEDYFLRWQYGTFARLIRLVAFLIAIFLPGMYVALSLFHQEMIPTELLASIAQSRETVPFPVIIEVLFMEISFELIREAGVRVPTTLGQTIGIVGALILGQAAVTAGLVSPVLLIVVAITGLGNFSVPNYSLAIAMRIIRFIYIISGAIVGFYGIVVMTFILACLSASMKSFGVPYFSPIAPKTKTNNDLVLREPLWKLQMRPDILNTKIRGKNKDPRGWKNMNNGDDKND